MHSHAAASRFLTCSIWSSVAGVFPGATSAPLATRKALLSSFFRSPESSGEHTPSNIVSHMLRNKYHQSLFFCLKESLIYCVNSNTSVRKIVVEFHGWEEFCALVRNAMEAARRSLAGPPETALERFDRTLQHVSKQKIRKLFNCPGARDWERELTQECEKHFTGESIRERSPHWEALKKAVIRHPDTFLDLSWLRGLAFRPGDSPSTCSARGKKLSALADSLKAARDAFYFDGSKTRLRAILKQFSWDDYLVDVADLSESFLRKRQCHFVSLPCHVTIMQIRSLRRVFNVPNGTKELPPLCGVAAICECCRSFRSFLTPRKKRAAASNGKRTPHPSSHTPSKLASHTPFRTFFSQD